MGTLDLQPWSLVGVRVQRMLWAVLIRFLNHCFRDSLMPPISVA
jgi:hypothetical protein